MTLAIETSLPRSGAAHCSFTDIEITGDLMDEGQTPAVTYPPDEPYRAVLVELLDRYLTRSAAEPES